MSVNINNLSKIDPVKEVKQEEQVIKNKRGTAVFMGFALDIEFSKFNNILSAKKNTASHRLGEVISESLDIWDETTKETSIEYKAKLLVIKEDDYKQMVKLLIGSLEDAGVAEDVRGRAMDIVIGVVK